MRGSGVDGATALAPTDNGPTPTCPVRAAVRGSLEAPATLRQATRPDSVAEPLPPRDPAWEPAAHPVKMGAAAGRISALTMDRIDLDVLISLARLRLDDGERQRARQQLERLLDHFDVLAEVDVGGVEPSPYPRPLELAARPDTPESPLPADEVVANAPAVRRGHFVVPKAFDA